MANGINQAIIDRIKKCFALAEDGRGATEGEVEAALAAARKLMDKYNIEQSEVDLAKDVEQSAADDVIEGVGNEFAQSVPTVYSYIAWVACYVCDVQFFNRNRTNAKGRKRVAVVFYGYPRDVAVACALFKELMVTMRSMARARLGKGWKPQHHDYCVGFAGRLVNRAREIQEAAHAPTAEAASSSTALVIYKKGAIDAYANTRLNLAKSKSLRVKRTSDWGAREMGAADANNVSLGTDDQIGGA